MVSKPFGCMVWVRQFLCPVEKLRPVRVSVLCMLTKTLVRRIRRLVKQSPVFIMFVLGCRRQFTTLLTKLGSTILALPPSSSRQLFPVRPILKPTTREQPNLFG